MSKQFIVRLKSGNQILANSQIITVKGLGTGTIATSDFTDGSLRGSVQTKNGIATLSKVIAGSDWTISAPSYVIQGGQTFTVNWSTKNNNISQISWFAVFPDTIDIFSGQSISDVGGINNLNIVGSSGSFTITASSIGKEEQFQIVLYSGSLADGVNLARSQTFNIKPFEFSAKFISSTISEGQDAIIEVYGVPFEDVTYRGETNGTIKLDKSGFFTGAINPGIRLAQGTFSWVIDGNKTDTVVTLTLTVKGIAFLNAKAENTLVANNMPISVTVTGAPGDVITAIRSDSTNPYKFKLPAAGASDAGRLVIDDIRGGAYTPAGSSYTWTFDGENTEGTSSVTVEVRAYSLAITPSSSSTASGRAIPVTISGVPNEIVTINRYPGVVKSTTLNNAGTGVVDLTFGENLVPGQYTWTFDGNRTPQVVTHTGTVFLQNALRVSYAGPAELRQNQPVTVTLSGTEGERVTFTGNTSGIVDLNTIGIGSIDVSLSSTLAVGTQTWIFSGNKSAGYANVSVKITSAANLRVTGNSTFVETETIPLTVFGANYEIITASVPNKLPVTFALSSTGTKVADITPMGFTAASNPYTVYFTGTYDPSLIVPFSFNVTPKYLLAVTGPTPSVVSGAAINVTITGAPAEVVSSTLNGVPGPSITLTTVGVGTLATGTGTMNLAAGITLAPSNSAYVWTFTGSLSKNTVWPTYSVFVNSPYNLTVTADTYSPPSGTAVNVTVSGAPGEVVNYTGSVNNGSITLSSPASGAGTYTFNILSGQAALSPGPYTWTFTGTAPRTTNTASLAITVGVAIPGITSFSRNSSDGRYYWVSTGSVVRHLVRATLNSATFNSASSVTVYDLYSTINSIGPVNLESGISSGTQVTFRLNVYNVQGGVSLPSDLTITIP